MRSEYRLRPLAPEDAAAVLEFERENRAYFARFVTDRGDSFFSDFGRHYADALAEQAAGRHAYHLLVAGDETLIGRVNLYSLEQSSARLGYRIAERFTGQGAASAGVALIKSLARDRYGLQRLTAGVAHTNLASARVLAKSGFRPVGPTRVAVGPGLLYECRLP